MTARPSEGVVCLSGTQAELVRLLAWGPAQEKLAEHGDDSVIGTCVAVSAAVCTTCISTHAHTHTQPGLAIFPLIFGLHCSVS